MTEKQEWWEEEPYRSCTSGCACTPNNAGHDGSCAWVYDIPTIIAEAERRERERIRGMIEQVKIVESPVKNFGNLSMEQIFKSGQMNTLMRINDLLNL